MTAVPIHTVVATPSSSTSPSHAAPATPHPPGSPQTTPGDPNHQQPPQQDSLEDIRSDLDHYPGGLSEPDPADQQALVDAVPHNEDGTPERFPDPFGSWSQLQNDGGITVPGRSNNCADCSRSFLETWYGNPQVSAARTPDYDENGNHDPFTPEDNANDNQIRWTGAAHTYAGPGGDPETANNIASVLQQSGHGSAAIVQVDWPNNGGGHAFNVVNHNGNIIWIDTQSGEVSSQPLHIDNAEHVWHIPLDADRNPIDTTQSGAEDSESHNDETQNQNDDESQPENSENNGQPENNQNPQNDASGDTSKQGGDPDTGTGSSKSADPSTPDAGDGRERSRDTQEGRQPSPDDSDADPRQQPQSQQSPSPETTSVQNRPSAAETLNTPDQQSRPDEATHPDEQDRTPDKESEQPTTTTESASRPDSPSEHRDPPTHTTPDSADNGTPDKGTPPTRTATDAPSDPTTNRDTPSRTTAPSDPRTSIPHQQTPDPRPADPRITDPRTTDPRTADARTSDPRTSDPRTSDPQRDSPTQKRPEANERPSGERPSTPPRPDQTRPDHLEDPRSETPDRDRSEAPDQTRPAGPNQSPGDDHRDRPHDMRSDSAVPTRESLPDGRNAEAANYVKDSVNGKKPLYGDIAAENPAQTSRPTSPERPSGPAEPAGNDSTDANEQARRRKRDLAMLARANSRDPEDKDWFEKWYKPKNGYRRSATNPAEDGRPVPQLHPTDDPDKPWMLASDVPDADREDYVDGSKKTGVRDEGISEDNQKRLDKAAVARQKAIDADRQPHVDRKAAKDAYEANATPENKKKFEEADALHSPLHGKMTRASETYGDMVAELHAMPEHFSEYSSRVDDRGTGNNRFDQIWTIPDSDPPQFVVVEAKGSLDASLGERRGLAPEEGSGQSPSPIDPSQEQGDGTQGDADQDDPRPGVPKVRQGTRAYFETILQEMQDRADRNELKAKTDAELEAAKAERALAEALDEALKANPSRIKYVLVKGNGEGSQHTGYEIAQFDIRTKAEKERDADSAT